MANARRRTQRTTTRNRSTSLRTAGMGTAATAPEVSEQERISRAMDWQGEYEYIKKDLRQLMLVSTFLFVLLFAIGFFL
jgi:hypothetical protein